MARMIRYKATYRDPKQSPFKPVFMIPTKVVEIEDTVPIEQVEEWARAPEACGGCVFVHLEIVS